MFETSIEQMIMIGLDFPRNKRAAGKKPDGPKRCVQMDYTTQRPLVGIEICVAKEGAGSLLGMDTPSMIGSLPFRVLVEFDEDYSEWVARCIDTDAVATGPTEGDAEAGIKAVLENDIRIAIREGSIKNLVRARASYDVIERWYQAVDSDPLSVRKTILHIPDAPAEAPQPIPRRPVQPEIQLFSRRKDGTVTH